MNTCGPGSKALVCSLILPTQGSSQLKNVGNGELIWNIVKEMMGGIVLIMMARFGVRLSRQNIQNERVGTLYKVYFLQKKASQPKSAMVSNEDALGYANTMANLQGHNWLEGGGGWLLIFHRAHEQKMWKG